ncbi:MAG TPA: ABC transporter permease [Thermoanaerobaculia bacterium]|nr:ABC transporter permease [Thermoanaerobaculia bacterium]
MTTLVQDLRYAIRFFRRSPGFAALAIATLALGIGANTAIFSVVNGVLFRPIPLPRGDRLAYFTRDGDVSVPDGVDWRARSKSFESISLFLRQWAFDWTGKNEPERLLGVVADGHFFGTLGVRAQAGRLYGPSDDLPGAARVAVLSDGFWKRRFGGDPGVVGRTLTLSDHPVTVIGVAPAEADFLQDGVELWVPPAAETPWALDERGTNNFDAIGRMRPGVRIQTAAAEIVAITTDLSRTYPKTNAHKIVRPLLLKDFLVRSVRPLLLVLLAAVGLVLLLASANLASLLLARASMRGAEMGVRLALGAGRGRIVRQLVTEGLLLSTAGAAAGVGLAALGKEALLSLAPAALPRGSEIGLDPNVLGFALLLALVTGVAFGLVPALSLGRTDAASALRGGEKGAAGAAGRHRALGIVAAAEVGLAFLLLIGSGLLLASFARLSKVPLGFEADHVLVASLVLPESRYSTREPQSRAFTAIVDRLRRLPGVAHAGSIIGAPLERGGIGGRIRIEGRPEWRANERRSARSRPVTGDYFQAMRLPVLQGRPITDADRETTQPVAVVNEAFVRQFFPNESPLGHRIEWEDWGKGRWMTIVGIAADAKRLDLSEPDEESIYSPYVQRVPDWQRFGTLVLRTSGDPAVYAQKVREAVWSFDPTLTVSGFATMEERKAASLASRRFSSTLLTIFGGSALLLAIQGIVGVLSYSVAQKRREIGIRIALGASPEDIFGSVLRRALRLTIAGLALGLLGALGATRLLAALLYGVGASDPKTYAIAAAVVLATALAACAVPARRAMRVDPMVAIRAE